MTNLERRISRRALAARDAGRRIIITLYPGDLVGVRLERTRREYQLPIRAVYDVAVKAEVARLRAVKAAQRKCH